jgi:hypothetical protein
VAVFWANDRSTLELDLRRGRRASQSWRQQSFARADRQPRRVGGRTAASDSRELALPTHSSGPASRNCSAKQSADEGLAHPHSDAWSCRSCRRVLTCVAPKCRQDIEPAKGLVVLGRMHALGRGTAFRSWASSSPLLTFIWPARAPPALLAARTRGPSRWGRPVRCPTIGTRRGVYRARSQTIARRWQDQPATHEHTGLSPLLARKT